MPRLINPRNVTLDQRWTSIYGSDGVCVCVCVPIDMLTTESTMQNLQCQSLAVTEAYRLRQDKTKQDNRQELTSTPEKAAKASRYSDRPSMSSHLANGMCFWTAPPSDCGGVAGVSVIVERFSRSAESVLRHCHGNWSSAYNEYDEHYKQPHNLLQGCVRQHILGI